MPRYRLLEAPRPGAIIGYRRNGCPIRLQAGASGPTLVNHTQLKMSSAATSFPVTIPATGTGNNLIVSVSRDASFTTFTITGMTLGGSADNFAAKVSEENTGGAALYSDIWEDWGAASGQTSLVINFSKSALCAVDVYEWSGLLNTGSAFDKSSVAQGSSGTGNCGNTGTLSQAVEVGIFMLSSYSSSFTAPSSGGWTNETQQTYGSTFYHSSGYQITSATTALTAVAASGPGNYYAGCIATFKAASGGGTVTGTGGLALGPLAFAGSGSVPYIGSGGLKLGPLGFAGSGQLRYSGGGGLALGPLRLAGQGVLPVTGTGGIRLGPLGLRGSSPGANQPGYLLWL